MKHLAITSLLLTACATEPLELGAFEQRDDNGEWVSEACFPEGPGVERCIICFGDVDTETQCVEAICPEDESETCTIITIFKDAVPVEDIVLVEAGGSLSSWSTTTGSHPIVPTQTYEPYQVAGAHDLDGDAIRDVVVATPAGTVIAGDTLYRSPAGTRLERIADLDGDHREDLMWRRSTGALVVKLENGAQTRDVAPVLDPTWTLAGSGDFDRDTRGDLVWRKGTALRIWTMNGATRVSERTATASASWTLGAIGDFDGDGRDDILWRDSASTARIWRGGNASEATPPFALAAHYTIEGAHDVNGNQRDELLLRSANASAPRYQSLGVTYVEGAVVHGTAWTAVE
jgi:hypothetical protein